MASREHLIEYEKEALRELEDIGRIIGRKPEIYAQIRQILGYSDATVQPGLNGRTKKEHPKPEGTPKGDMSWEKYVEFILTELGGKRKTREINEYAVKANPNLGEDLIHNAIRGKLSAMYRDKQIGAKESKNRKEGYDYFAITKQEVETH
jgi:hypothetical protein